VSDSIVRKGLDWWQKLSPPVLKHNTEGEQGEKGCLRQRGNKARGAVAILMTAKGKKGVAMGEHLHKVLRGKSETAGFLDPLHLPGVLKIKHFSSQAIWASLLDEKKGLEGKGGL